MIKIKKIRIENNPILWTLELDFTKDDDSIYDTILFVWENGSGKSSLMDILYQFTSFSFNEKKLSHGERRTFFIEIVQSKYEIIPNWIYEIYVNNDIGFAPRANSSKFTILSWQQDITHNIFSHLVEFKDIVKSIFSDVSINFDAKVTNSTDKRLDDDHFNSIKSGENIAQDITQTLVDIKVADNADLYDWIDSNEGIAPPAEEKDQRTRRFKEAFDKMFADTWLVYKNVRDLNPIFEKNNQEIEINRLSSGEKQIVFRWGFLLKDKQSISWALVLVDEPEISMHPRWQKKTLDFYKNLFRDWSWNQTSQLIITTHSPYVLHSYNSNIDCVVVFSSEWIKKIDSMRAYIWTTPSLWVINWYAFNLPTIEFHDELYWYIQDKTQNYTIPKFENYVTNLLRDRFDKTYNRIEEVNGTPQRSKPCTLQTFIRNKIHHPENVSMQHIDYTEWELKQSIEDMIKCINNNSL